jgi:hypothetical protein
MQRRCGRLEAVVRGICQAIAPLGIARHASLSGLDLSQLFYSQIEVEKLS